MASSRPSLSSPLGLAVSLSCASMFLGACPTVLPPPTAPGGVVRAYEAARRAGRRSERWRVDGVEDLRPLPPHGPPTGEPRLVRRDLRWPPAGHLQLRATWSGPTVKLGLPRLGARTARTPEAAVALFAEALMARDYGAVLALLPSEEASHWTEARLAAAWDGGGGERWRRVAAALLASGLSLTLGPESDNAQAVAPGGLTVLLVRQVGAWKVADLRPHATVLAPGAEGAP